jgi:Icc-related predicted phosphoesterase
MRIVLISDTHGLHTELQVPDGDILIHAGDICMTGGIPEVSNFNIWLGTLPHRHKIIIAGNHDFSFEKEARASRKELTNGRYLQDSFVMCEGLKIYGSPWQPWFYDWAFNLERGAEIKKKWDLIPEDVDILVTHGPPFGILDTASDGQSVGCKDLLERVAMIKPKIHAFGHIHPAYGEVEKDGIKFANCSVCNADYKAINSPIIIDL